MLRTPVKAQAMRPSDRPALSHWVQICWRTGSERSVKAPAMGAINITGARSAAAMTPSQVGELVSSHASQPIPTRCIHNVTRLGVIPPMNSAYWR